MEGKVTAEQLENLDPVAREEFNRLVEANVKNLMLKYHIKEPRAVEAYGWVLKITEKALQPSECVQYIESLMLKELDMFTKEEAKLGVAIGRVKVKGKPFLSAAKQVGRNEPCPCGSGQKAKKCCLDLLKEEDRRRLYVQSNP